jgi:lysophospholipase L1-like esterase
MTEISLQVSETVAVTLDVGEQGETGLTGAQGETGLTGADSVVAGPIGLTGLTGDTGETGIVEQATPPDDVSVLWLDSSADAVPVDLSGVEPAGLSAATKEELSATFAQLGAHFAHLDMAMKAGGSSVGLQVIGDSTGNETGEWVYLLGQSLAARYPSVGVRHRLWNDATQRYDAPAVIQTPPLGYRHVNLTGGFMWFPHTAAQSIVGDIDVRVKVAMNDWTPATNQVLVSKFGGVGKNAWRFYVNASGRPVFEWSTNGAYALPSIVASVSPTVADGTELWLRATLDVDNGSGGYTATLYTSADGSSWTTLGSAVTTTAGVTNIFDANNQMELGSRASGADILAGKVFEVEVRKGIDGPTVLPVAPGQWQPSGSLTHAGSPVLDIINASHSGASIAYLNDAVRLPKLTPDYGTLLTFISCSHNDGTWLGPTYLMQYDTLLASIKARQPLTVPVVIGQNPRSSPATWLVEHASRIAQQRAWASRNGAAFVNVYGAFTSDPRALSLLVSGADGIHPTAAGSVLWRDTILKTAAL